MCEKKKALEHKEYVEGVEKRGVSKLQTAKEFSTMIAEANKKAEAYKRLTRTLISLGLDPKQDDTNNSRIDAYLKAIDSKRIKIDEDVKTIDKES